MTVFTISLKKLNDFLNKEKQYKTRLIYAATRLLNKEIKLITVLEPEYHEFLPLFSR